MMTNTYLMSAIRFFMRQTSMSVPASWSQSAWLSKLAVSRMICLLGFLLGASNALALVTITPADATISADTTSVSPGTGAWTSLAGPVIEETANKDIQNPGSIILNVPTGFQFNTAAGSVTVAVTCSAGGGSDVLLASSTATLSATQITINVTSVGGGSRKCTLTWSGIQVRPNLPGTTLSVGDITLGGTAAIQGAPAGTSLGTLTEVVGAPARLAFASQPGSAVAGMSLGTVSVLVQDRFGNTVTSATNTVSLAIGSNPGSGTLSGTASVAAASGLATFGVLSIDKTGTGYTLVATSGALTSATSTPFDITPGVLNSFMVEASGGGPIGNQAQNVSFGIRVTARDVYLNLVTSYGGTAVISSTGTLSAGGGTTSAFTAGVLDPRSVTISNSGTFTITATSGAITGASNTFVVSAGVGGFDAFETGIAPPAATAGAIRTKVAGTAFSLDIVALNASKSAQISFTGTVTVSLLGNLNTGIGLDANGCPVSSTTLQTFDVVMTSTARQNVAFAAVSNAWRDVRVRISYAGPPAVTSCSRDNFAVRPAFFAVAAQHANRTTEGTAVTLNNPNIAGTTVHNAGRPFRITATAYNSAGVPAVASNYADAPTAAPLIVCAGTACTATHGTLTPGTWTPSAGTVTTTTATYNEVGAFSLQLSDTSFANVDASDSTAAERTITSVATTVGRFVPDHFALGLGTVLTNRSDIASCSGSSYTYMSEPFQLTYVLQAQNAANGLTALYTAGNGLARLDGATIAKWTQYGSNDSLGLSAIAANLTFSGDTLCKAVFSSAGPGFSTTYSCPVATPPVPLNAPAPRVAVSASPTVPTGTWLNGAGTFSAHLLLNRASAPDGPFSNLRVGIAPQDADGVVANGFNLDADNNGGNERVQVSTASVRFGKLKLSNAHGSELLNLPLPISTEYWSGSYFVQNIQDNCTVIAVDKVGMGNRQGGITSTNMTLIPSPGNVSMGGAFVAGKGSLTLTKPIPIPTAKGSVDVTIDLADKAYLRSGLPSSGLTFNSDPSSRATFGIYKRGPIIYMREMY